MVFTCLCYVGGLLLQHFSSLHSDSSRARRKDPKRDTSDQLMKAFYTVMLVLVAVARRYLCSLAWIVFHVRPHKDCLVLSSVVWFSLLSALVLLLLFLHRSGAFTLCISNACEEHSPAWSDLLQTSDQIVNIIHVKSYVHRGECKSPLGARDLY